MIAALTLATACASAAASRVPELRASTWLNVPSGAPPDLRGKVVLVEFWTFG